MLKKIYLIALISVLSFSAFNQTISKAQKNKDFAFDYTKVKNIKDANYGMVIIPGGNLEYTSSDNKTQKITISPFWMDQNEVTNLQYRMFVEWVRDSIAMRICVFNGLEDFAIRGDHSNIDIELYDPWDYQLVFLNWEMRDELWNSDDSEILYCLEEMYYPTQDRFLKNKEIDTRKLVYEYYYTDIKQVSKKNIKYIYDDLGGTGQLSDGHYGTLTDSSKAHFISFDYDDYNSTINVDYRNDFIQHKKVRVYPDTLVWFDYFPITYNEPIIRKYFSHPAYNNYPVVGVSWEQANAFCHWRTKIVQQQLSKKSKNPPIAEFRLPTEAEWEFAARGGKANMNYPWGNDNPQDKCNFDGANINTPTMARSFIPNNFGLYDMAGNIAEWTSTNHDKSRMNKIIKGGSWNDNKDFVKNSAKTYNHIDSANVFVGFRCIRSLY